MIRFRLCDPSGQRWSLTGWSQFHSTLFLERHFLQLKPRTWTHCRQRWSFFFFTMEEKPWAGPWDQTKRVCLVLLSDKKTNSIDTGGVSPSYITLSIILGPESGQIRLLQKFYYILMIWCCLLDGQAGATVPSLTIKPSRPWKQLWLYVKGFVLAVQNIFFLTHKIRSRPSQEYLGGGGGGA